MRKNLIFICILSALSISACTSLLPTPHKIDIQQGNRIKPETLEKLQLGMTQQQAKFILGTPLLQDAFHKNRWDYIYYYKAGSGETKQSRLRLIFEGDTLAEIDRSHYRPEDQVNTLKANEVEQEASPSRGGGGHSH